jgi:hypothetical protein
MTAGAVIADANGALEGAFYPNNIIDADFQSRYLARFKTEAQIKFAADTSRLQSLRRSLRVRGFVRSR